MTRSIKKGPNVNYKLLKKIAGKKPADVGVINCWCRDSQISPDMVGFTFGVHNGKTHHAKTVGVVTVSRGTGAMGKTCFNLRGYGGTLSWRICND